MTDTAISVNNLSKRYRIGSSRGGYRTLREAIITGLKAPFRRLKNFGKASYREEDSIWALQDVSFQVERGEVLGIIGKNGAGKTTLLKVLSRITEPTEGRARLNGRVGSLLQVGTGFHPELTGRENIYLSGTILGMSRREVDRRFDEIVGFSGIGQYIDTPVKRYSSGMWVRLGFAVAAHLDPEILLIDEVLAVGDAEFQKKCLGKMDDVAKSGRTVLFVSHNMGSIHRLCERAIWLDEGELMMKGTPEEAISEYLLRGSSETGENVWENGKANKGIDELKISAIRIKDLQGRVTPRVSISKPFFVEIEFEVNERLRHCRVGFSVNKFDGTIVFSSYDSDEEKFQGPRTPGSYETRCKIPPHLLNTGEYTISIDAEIPKIKDLVQVNGALSFTVERTGAVGSHMEEDREGVIRPRLDWQSVDKSN